MRWVVLETPQPDEDICGCARLKLQQSMILVDVLAAIGSEDTTKMISRSLLMRVELIARSFNFLTVSVELSSSLSEQLPCLNELGFLETSGYFAPRDDSLGRTAGTMIQVFSKNLQPSLPATSNASIDSHVADTSQSADEILQAIHELSLDQSSDTAPTSISGMIEDLFTALHSEYPEQAES
jgi:hypothetical protein